MNNKVYIFDVDGTLTPARQPATKEFLSFFETWAKESTFYLCSGSDLEKIKEQLPESILNLASGVFACMGNAFYIDKEKIYQKDFIAPEGFERYLSSKLNNSKFPLRTGNHIEKRIGMWNFSTIGRNATLKEREKYFAWDQTANERKVIVEEINRMFPEVSATAGGEISLDLNHPGQDKSQVAKEILKIKPDASLVFIGDKTLPGGNDYALAKEITTNYLGISIQTQSWKETITILKTLTSS